MGKIKDYSIFFFLLIFICMSNISYANGPGNVDVSLLAIGIHYQGQPDTTWVVKEVTNGTTYQFRDGQIQSAIEMGIAGDLSAGVVDKIALKIVFSEVGGGTERGWDVDDGDPVDQETPPANAKNFLDPDLGGSSITLDNNSNKKFLFKSSNNGDDSVVISDM